MAGLNVGAWGNFPGQPQNKVIPKPKPEPQQSMGRRRRHRNREEGIDTGPTKPPINPRGQMGGLNVGLGSVSKILPSPMDPFRTYGTVEGGRVIPPANPYGQNQPIRFTPGGEYGPPPSPMMPPGINTGPTQMPPWFEPPTGGFTGGQMPPPIGSETSGMMGGGMPPSRIPGRPQRSPFGGGRIGGGFSGMYR